MSNIIFIYFVSILTTSNQHKDTNLILYADDTAIATDSKNNDLYKNHQLALEQTNDWIKENKLCLNAKKMKNILSKGQRNFRFEKELILKVKRLNLLKISNT